MVSVLDSGASGPGPGHFVVFLCETLYSHGASLHLSLLLLLSVHVYK